jgi:hypothetical protein
LGLLAPRLQGSPVPLIRRRNPGSAEVRIYQIDKRIRGDPFLAQLFQWIACVVFHRAIVERTITVYNT